MDGSIDVKMIMSGLSFCFTAYFWFVKARRERPQLEFHQISNYRVSSRRHPNKPGFKRVYFQQIDTGGVLIVNHSTRQNSVVLFECFLLTPEGRIRGDWGYGGEDKPPWNVGPESTIAFSPACFFDLHEDEEVPENPQVLVQFITPSGKHFSHRFSTEAPRFGAATLERAA